MTDSRRLVLLAPAYRHWLPQAMPALVFRFRPPEGARLREIPLQVRVLLTDRDTEATTQRLYELRLGTTDFRLPRPDLFHHTGEVLVFVEHGETGELLARLSAQVTLLGNEVSELTHVDARGTLVVDGKPSLPLVWRCPDEAEQRDALADDGSLRRLAEQGYTAVLASTRLASGADLADLARRVAAAGLALLVDPRAPEDAPEGPEGLGDRIRALRGTAGVLGYWSPGDDPEGSEYERIRRTDPRRPILRPAADALASVTRYRDFALAPVGERGPLGTVEDAVARGLATWGEVAVPTSPESLPTARDAAFRMLAGPATPFDFPAGVAGLVFTGTLADAVGEPAGTLLGEIRQVSDAWLRGLPMEPLDGVPAGVRWEARATGDGSGVIVVFGTGAKGSVTLTLPPALAELAEKLREVPTGAAAQVDETGRLRLEVPTDGVRVFTTG